VKDKRYGNRSSAPKVEASLTDDGEIPLSNTTDICQSGKQHINRSPAGRFSLQVDLFEGEKSCILHQKREPK